VIDDENEWKVPHAGRQFCFYFISVAFLSIY
jgi:hypothetical protein